MKHEYILWQMGIAPLRKKLGLVNTAAQIILMPAPAAASKNPATEKSKDISEMTLKQASTYGHAATTNDAAAACFVNRRNDSDRQ